MYYVGKIIEMGGRTKGEAIEARGRNEDAAISKGTGNL